MLQYRTVNQEQPMTTPIRVDLSSDTVSRPTAAMREAMAAAEVGDEQLGEDPTTCQLQNRVAEMLGKEAAVFMPSGTMCNAAAIRVHCRPGDEVITDRSSHVVNFEVGGAAALSGVSVYPLDGDRGVFDVADVEQALRPAHMRHQPRSRLVSIEQTSNRGGGTIWPVARIRAICGLAHEHGLAVHMDGARLLNAVVASGVGAREYVAQVDSVWIDFSKGLGAPVGAVLAGSAAFIEDAWRAKQQLGGAMRQSGVLAACCLHALDHHVDRLAQDHDHARRFAEGLATVAGIEVAPVETNIVFFDVSGTGLTSVELVDRTLQDGVRIGMGGTATRLRAVTHLDVDRDGIERAVVAVREAVRSDPRA